MRGIVIGALAVSALLTAPVLAGEETTEVVVTGGELAITAPRVAAFEAKTALGAVQTSAAELEPFAVADLRGTGAGWRIVARAEPLSGATKTLPPGSLALSDLTAAPRPGLTSPPPVTPDDAVAIDAGPVTIASAGRDEGMGIHDFAAATGATPQPEAPETAPVVDGTPALEAPLVAPVPIVATPEPAATPTVAAPTPAILPEPPAPSRPRQRRNAAATATPVETETRVERAASRERATATAVAQAAPAAAAAPAPSPTAAALTPIPAEETPITAIGTAEAAVAPDSRPFRAPAPDAPTPAPMPEAPPAATTGPEREAEAAAIGGSAAPPARTPEGVAGASPPASPAATPRPTGTEPAPAPITAEAIVVEAMTAEQEASPGQPQAYRFRVTNTAAAPLAVELSAVNSREGWSGTVLREDGGTPLTGAIAIAPSRSVVVVAAVTVPLDARVGDRNRVSLRVSLVGDGAAADVGPTGEAAPEAEIAAVGMWRRERG